MPWILTNDIHFHSHVLTRNEIESDSSRFSVKHRSFFKSAIDQSFDFPDTKNIEKESKSKVFR